MSAIAATSPACIATSMPSPHRTEEMAGDDRRPRAGVPRAPAHRDARHHRRRARAQSAFPPAGATRARASACTSWTAAISRSWKSPARRTSPHSSRAEQVEVVASMPCYLEDNVDRQRGKGVFDGSIRGLQAAQRARLRPRRRRASCSTSSTIRRARRCRRRRTALEADYKRVLGERYGIVFNQLFTLANMPIQRFGVDADRSRASSTRYLGAAARRACRRQSRQRHVPQPDLGRLARLSSTTATSTRCSTCRSATAARERVHLSDLLDADLDGQPDPRRRPLLRLHRRPRIELRRRADAKRAELILPEPFPLGSALGSTPMARLSIIMPVLDEGEAHRRRARCARRAARAWRRGHRRRRRQPATRPCSARGCGPIMCSRRRAGAALQMNAGAAKASGDVLLFLHADTRLPREAERLVLDGLARSGRDWGRFDVTIAGRHPLLRLVGAHDEPALAHHRHRDRRPGDLRQARGVRRRRRLSRRSR